MNKHLKHLAGAIALVVAGTAAAETNDAAVTRAALETACAGDRARRAGACSRHGDELPGWFGRGASGVSGYGACGGVHDVPRQSEAC